MEVKNPEATVVVSALDSKPIGDSAQLLITTVARVASYGGDPYVSEPVVGKLAVKAAAGKTLVPLSPDGSQGAALPTSYQGGVYSVTLDKGKFSHWYLLN